MINSASDLWSEANYKEKIMDGFDSLEFDHGLDTDSSDYCDICFSSL